MSNRLEKEQSPYLRQHKDNPVDWYPWCDEAFERAKKENKAIFISIGYSSCHWCHVMEEKVFKDKECAKLLNRYFISIKVDREERPDIDKHYQEVYALLNRRAGGWPTSVFCTPQNKPFFAGTYIPPESEEGSIEGMGFRDIARLIGTKIEANDEQIYKNADEVESFLKHEEHPKEATVLKEDFKNNYLHQVKNNYETKFGGFSDAPKFPHVATLTTLLTIDRLYNDKAAKAMVTHTLESMTKGGFYDRVDGGFCRYSTDKEWRVPHFEKMLYDNALLGELFCDAYLAYKDEKYLKTAKEVVEFCTYHMSDGKLFYSALDADTNSNEGEYYLYGYDELYNAFEQNGYKNTKDLLNSLGVSKEGVFEGKNIIRFDGEIKDYDTKIKPLLLKLRDKKEYPFVDKKIQTSWSAMMIKTLFKLGNIDKNYQKKALVSLDALINTMFKEQKLYHTTIEQHEPKVEAFLEDYAYLIDALLEAYNSTQDEMHLINAHRFTNMALERFYKRGVWYFSDNEFKTKADISDNTYKSSVALMVDALLGLSLFLEDDKYREFAFKTLEYNSYEIARRAVLYPSMIKCTLRYLKGDRVIKSNEKNLIQNSYAIGSLKYPFILKKASNDENFTVCGEKSCFAHTNDVEKLNELVEQTF